MLALITQQRKRINSRDEDSLQIRYLQFLSSFGITAIPLPNDPDLADKYFHLPVEGLILSGGGDLSPELYGGNPLLSRDCSIERDATENLLLKLALERRIPVFLICRGVQFLNVYFGGKLEQEVKNHVATKHPVFITSPEAAAYFNDSDNDGDSNSKNNSNNRYNVNSYHHQGISRAGLSPQLRIFAESAEGLVEGLYHPGLPIAGVQWHPERDQAVDINTKLMDAFIKRELFWRIT